MLVLDKVFSVIILDLFVQGDRYGRLGGKIYPRRIILSYNYALHAF